MHLWKSTRLTTPPCYLPLKFFAKKSDKIFFAQDPLHMDRRSIILTTEGFIKRYKTFLPDAMPVQIEYAAELYELITHDNLNGNTMTITNECGVIIKETCKDAILRMYPKDRGKGVLCCVLENILTEDEEQNQTIAKCMAQGLKNTLINNAEIRLPKCVLRGGDFWKLSLSTEENKTLFTVYNCEDIHEFICI